MTNTLHRQGTERNLKGDYVVFMTTAAGINRERSAPAIREFMRICQKYHPINMGNIKQGNIYQEGVEVEKLIANLGDGAGSTAVFTDLDTVQKVVEELIQADLGISINISGLLDEVQECCRRTGINPPQRRAFAGFLGGQGAPAREGDPGNQHPLRPWHGLLQL